MNGYSLQLKTLLALLIKDTRKKELFVQIQVYNKPVRHTALQQAEQMFTTDI